MARGRIIYPAFWHDSKIVRITDPWARLFYIGMWNHSFCGQGHLPDDAFDLKLKILPADPVDADELLGALVAAGRVVRLTVEGESFLWIPTFSRHQQKDDPRHETRCPVCRHEQTRQNTDKFPQGEERSREGSERGGDAPSPYCEKHPKGTDEPCRACGRARVARQDWDKAQKNRPTPAPPKKNELCPEHPDLGYRRSACPMEH